MESKFTAIIEKDGVWYIAYCPEIPGANGQGKTAEEAKESLAAAISLISEIPDKLVRKICKRLNIEHVKG